MIFKTIGYGRFVKEHGRVRLLMALKSEDVQQLQKDSFTWLTSDLDNPGIYLVKANVREITDNREGKEDLENKTYTRDLTLSLRRASEVVKDINTDLESKRTLMLAATLDSLAYMVKNNNFSTFFIWLDKQDDICEEIKLGIKNFIYPLKNWIGGEYIDYPIKKE